MNVILRNPNEAFKNAIVKGLKNPEEYMYMESDSKVDHFKHIDTRKYIFFEYTEEHMKAWRVTNTKSGQYTESTFFITIQRELLNMYSMELRNFDIKKVLEMNVGDVSTIGDLEITCKEV